MSKENKVLMWMVLLYYALNILVTYFISTELLNRYINTFPREFLNETTSILGNIAALSLLLCVGLFLLPKKKWFAIYLVILSLGLNIMLFAINFFNRSYRAMFSRYNFSLTNNPDAGFANTVIIDAVMEAFSYYRIVLFLPFLILLGLLIFFWKNISYTKNRIPIIKKMIFLFSSGFVSLATLLVFQVRVKDNWLFRPETPMYGVQTAGLYNYYLSEFVYGMDYRVRFEKEDLERVLKELRKYDKNVVSYVNEVDNKMYSSIDYQTGMWQGKNVYIIQLESWQSFVFDAVINGNELTPYLNDLIKEEDVFYFDNVFTNVGMGNTADAEFAFHTGFYPIGDNTIHWDFAKYRFSIDTIPKFLGDEYAKISFNNVRELFYNHKDVHENLFGYDSFRGVESLEIEYPLALNPEKYLAHDSTVWVSDQFGLYWAVEKTKANEKEKTFVFNMTVTPHMPFIDMSVFYDTYQKHNWRATSNKDTQALHNYLDQITYNDKILYDFIKDVTDPGSKNYLENTVFVLYGDHGNNIPKGAYEELFDRPFTGFEYDRVLLNIPIIVIDPTKATSTSIQQAGMKKDDFLHQVKAQRDLYRTIVNALGVNSAKYFGVNIFSGEPGWSYDPKNVEIFLDGLTYNYKDGSYEFIGSNIAAVDESLIDYIVKYKQYQDYFLTLQILNEL